MNHTTVVTGFLGAFLIISMLVGMGVFGYWLCRLLWSGVAVIYNLFRGNPLGTPLVVDPLTKEQDKAEKYLKHIVASFGDYIKASHGLIASCSHGEICTKEAFKEWVETCLTIEENMYVVRPQGDTDQI